MRKLVLALLLALSVLGMATSRASAGQDAFDFGDMPPLPPPLLDDAPAPPPLTMQDSPTATSPLLPPSLTTPPAATAGNAPIAPAPSTTSPLAPSLIAAPLAPPPLSPLPQSDEYAGVPPVELPGTAGLPAAPAQAAATLMADETPRPGKISGGRVNVRAGPSTQYESIDVLTTGAQVTVLAKNGEWFKIVFPQDKLASIHKNFVTADISGEIPEEGVPGVVNQDDVDIHAFYWDKSTVVGKLSKGDPVVIKQERGQWYRIDAPETARAYVFAEYVRVDGADQVAVDSAPPPENPAVDMNAGKQDATGRLKLSDNDRRANELKERYFESLQENFQRRQEEAVVHGNQLEEALDSLEQQLRAIDQETTSGYSYPVSTTTLGSAGYLPADPLYGGFYGFVENIGRVGGAPASYRLVKNGEIRYYLRSDSFDLAMYVGQRVWVNGAVELASGASANVLSVNQIRTLTEAEVVAAGGQPFGVGAPEQRLVQSDTMYDAYAPVVTDQYGNVIDDPYLTGSGMNEYVQPGQPTPPPPGVTDASQLPDVVGAGMAAPLSGSVGEVDTDYFESPIISEIGP